ncbi:hypothetical protein P691DRAFT_762330 [Macrolepiota fuliginosa MF-IS2]|uniref:Uncharacterized protein n=1 Tax=Macrolepiota fuliginosa MF-IS2 TaxID=1400762 RepID=A0A9P5X8I7_9AGAR|nr:hypothetical protein P691DRAFT_762330 [Macrolepiota fuliginosa MF-IS2]
MSSPPPMTDDVDGLRRADKTGDLCGRYIERKVDDDILEAGHKPWRRCLIDVVTYWPAPPEAEVKWDLEAEVVVSPDVELDVCEYRDPGPRTVVQTPSRGSGTIDAMQLPHPHSSQPQKAGSQKTISSPSQAAVPSATAAVARSLSHSSHSPLCCLTTEGSTDRAAQHAPITSPANLLFPSTAASRARSTTCLNPNFAANTSRGPGLDV